MRVLFEGLPHVCNQSYLKKENSMIKITDLKNGRDLKEREPFIAALGDFDGVHIGHRAVIERTVRASRARGIRSAAWFFGDSPKAAGEKLSDTAEKERIFSSLGLELSVKEEFDEVKDLSPEEFVKGYLRDLGCRGAVCGFNFRFGKDRSGDSAALVSLCKEAGMYFYVVPPVYVRGSTVSSSAIRALLSEGDMRGAAAMLGRPYSVCSEVTHGRTLGAKLGFPTINQNFIPGRAVPRRGVYFTYTAIGGAFMPSVSNVGSRPTVGGHVCRLETHILNRDIDLYGAAPEVFFVEFRRPELVFDGEDELTSAVKEDIAAAEKFFAAGEKGENRIETE